MVTRIFGNQYYLQSRRTSWWKCCAWRSMRGWCSWRRSRWKGRSVSLKLEKNIYWCHISKWEMYFQRKCIMILKHLLNNLPCGGPNGDILEVGGWWAGGPFAPGWPGPLLPWRDWAIEWSRIAATCSECWACSIDLLSLSKRSNSAAAAAECNGCPGPNGLQLKYYDVMPRIKPICTAIYIFDYKESTILKVCFIL